MRTRKWSVIDSVGYLQPATPRSSYPFLPRWRVVGLFIVVIIRRFAVVFDSRFRAASVQQSGIRLLVKHARVD